MKYLWLYLSLCGAFSAGWSCCAILSWHKIKRAEQRIENLKKLIICIEKRE